LESELKLVLSKAGISAVGAEEAIPEREYDSEVGALVGGVYRMINSVEPWSNLYKSKRTLNSRRQADIGMTQESLDNVVKLEAQHRGWRRCGRLRGSRG
jgi:hypothetical protein